MLPDCICCGSGNLVSVGRIPHAIYFAGRLLDEPLSGGELLRCKDCGLAFRYPQLDKIELDALYRQGKDDNWHAADSSRSEWQLANRWIARMVSTDASVLDVGCFDGGFLQSIADEHSKFGVEIHEAACKVAGMKGIDIIGKDFTDLSDANMCFDAVTSFDVIEHTKNPYDFLSSLAKVTRKDGVIIISSGNLDSLSWRFMGTKYWYCTLPEHLSFISPRWCEWVAPLLGLEVKQVIQFPHIRVSFLKRFSYTVKNLFYRISPWAYASLRSLGMGGDEYRRDKNLLRHPPGWMSAKDHFICMFVKK